MHDSVRVCVREEGKIRFGFPLTSMLKMKGDVGEQSWFSKFEAASHQGTEDYK